MLAQSRLPDSGLIAASGGNHGAAVAYVARELGLRAEIFVPEIAAPAKIARLRDYGANLRVIGRNYAEALAASRVRQRDTGALEIHAYDAFDVVTGQGTLALELLRECPDLEVLVVPVGGGGLLAGVAVAVRSIAPNVELVGVQAAACASMVAALHGEQLEVSDTVADGIAVREPGKLTLPIIR